VKGTFLALLNFYSPAGFGRNEEEGVFVK